MWWTSRILKSFALAIALVSVLGCLEENAPTHTPVDNGGGPKTGPDSSGGPKTSTSDTSKTPADTTPHPKDSTPVVKIIPIHRDSTWGPLFIKDSSEIPLNEFKAFYFQDSLQEITAFTERVKYPTLNYSYAEFHGIPASRFNGYWIGRFEFSEATVQQINLSVSRATARILVDKQEIFFGENSTSLLHTFSKGVHTIEVEYKNDWHTIQFSATFAAVISDKPVEKIDTSMGAVYWYAGAYEAGNADNSIQLAIRKSEKPIFLFLSSYKAVRWDITLVDSTQALSVFVSGFESPSTVTGLRPSVPVDYSKQLPYAYKLLPACQSISNYCEELTFQKLVDTLGSAFKVRLNSFAGAYNPTVLILPDVVLDSAKSKQIADDTKALQDANRDLTLAEIFAGDTTPTWQPRFITSDSQIPVGKFRAFYFDEKKPNTVVHTETIDSIAVDYSWSDFHTINARNFAGYWVGRFEFSVPTVVSITVSQSHAETEIYSDKVKLFSGKDGKTILHTFQPGSHLLEVEHVNNWHTMHYLVKLEAL